MCTKISVIIPVYNVEEYLEQCLDSVINQPLEDIEVICINDGSTDNSLEILEEYAKKDYRIKIINKKNEGIGVARNIGIDHAKGKYIIFLDSDDWLKNNAFKNLYDIIILDNIDILIFKILPYDENSDKFFKRDDYELLGLENLFKEDFVTYKDIKEDIFNISVVAYNKIYKKSFLDKHNLKFPERLIFEDNPFFFDAIINAKKIKFNNEYYLYRRFRDNSVISLVDESHFDIIPISNMIIEVFKDNNLFEMFKFELFNKKIMLIMSEYESTDYIYKKKFFNLIKNDFLRFNLSFEDFIDNFKESNLYFYLNALKYDNFWEFDFYNLKSKLELQINFFKQDNINLKNWITKLENNNNNLKNNNKKLKSKTIQLKKSNNNLKNENKELLILINNLKNDKKKIFSSKSWKITKPLREIFKLFK